MSVRVVQTMPFWVVQDSAAAPPPGFVPRPDIAIATAGELVVDGPYADRGLAEDFASQRRARRPAEPWTVVRVVEAGSRGDAAHHAWPDVVDARRVAWGRPTVAQERAQQAAALAAHPVPPVPETVRLAAALEARGESVSITEPRTRIDHGQTRVLRTGAGDVVNLLEYDHESNAWASMSRLIAQRADVVGATRMRLHLFQQGRLVVLYGGSEPRMLATLEAVLGGVHS